MCLWGLSDSICQDLFAGLYLPGYIAGFYCKVIGRRGWLLWHRLRAAYVCTARHADQWRIALFDNASSCAYSAEHRSLLHCKRSFFCFLRMRQLEQLSALLRRVFRLGGVLLSLNLCMFIQSVKLHICGFCVIRVPLTPFLEEFCLCIIIRHCSA